VFEAGARWGLTQLRLPLSHCKSPRLPWVILWFYQSSTPYHHLVSSPSKNVFLLTIHVYNYSLVWLVYKANLSIQRDADRYIFTVCWAHSLYLTLPASQINAHSFTEPFALTCSENFRHWSILLSCCTKWNFYTKCFQLSGGWSNKGSFQAWVLFTIACCQSGIIGLWIRSADGSTLLC
jgi:hypothetical protein